MSSIIPLGPTEQMVVDEVREILSRTSEDLRKVADDFDAVTAGSLEAAILDPDSRESFIKFAQLVKRNVPQQVTYLVLTGAIASSVYGLKEA